MAGLAVLAVSAAVWLVFGQDAAEPDISTATDVTEPVPTPTLEPKAVFSLADEGEPNSSDSELAEKGTGEPSEAELRELRMAPGGIPPEFVDDFLRGTAPISDERRAEMEKGILEIPPEIEQEMKNAGRRPIPPEVLRDFQNPYPEISAEVLEQLRQYEREQGAP